MTERGRAEQLRLDVSAAVGEPASLAATHYAAGTPNPTVLVCLPGGTYNRGYWHLDVPDHPGYNFADYAVQHGYSVVAIDPLGTGDSTRPARDIALADIAAALNCAISALPEITDSTAAPVAVAHSLGGYLAILQQAAAPSYAALAILGCTNQHVAPLNLDPEFVAAAGTSQGRALLIEQFAGMIPEPYMETSRDWLQSWFHLPDVPAAVLTADNSTTISVAPRCFSAAAIPGVAAEEAASVAVPVFLGYGEVDVSPDPRAEARFYSHSPDITTFIVPGSAHCHNMASTRRLLWRRLLAWIAGVAGSAAG
ncbi:lysophospholipase [Mycobacterium kyorinense]|uniref:Lysophospholipase n=1 Tax=Mycobacterium kyorinense TaxID=487514 RepID=A0A1A2ZKM7_9MYCO|nr:alpha/beta hydrolase [Mycobacterium kyorinense]OBI50037.1 lysophospholipase [Mycobacterium kyorinense]